MCDIINIKSSYICDIIFSFIKDKCYKYNLIRYSKICQKKLSINKNDYENKYLNYYKFNKLKITDYFYLEKKNYKDNNDTFNKNYLSNKFNKDLSKYNISLNKYLEYLDYFLEKNNSKNYIIDIFSPFLKFLSNKDCFEKIFSIDLDIDIIKKNNLEKDFQTTFAKLNESKTNNYGLRITINENNFEIGLFKQYNIDINKIKKLSIKQTNWTKINEFIPSLLTLLSDKNIQTNLLYLNISLYQKYNFNDSINIINNFINLQILSLDNFTFKDNIKLKLNNLTKLYLFNCKNIIITENIYLHLKTLELKNSYISNETLISFPELEDCCLDNNPNNQKLIDLKTSKKLKILDCYSIDFLKLGDAPLLEDLSIKDIEKKEVLEKIIEFKNLKELKILINNMNFNDLSEIKGRNNSLTYLELYNHTKNDIVSIYKLLDLFPNLKTLNLFTITEYDELVKTKRVSKTHVILGEKSIRDKFMDLKDLIKLLRINEISIKYGTQPEEKVRDIIDYFNEVIKGKTTPQLEDQILKSIIDFQRCYNDNKVKLYIKENKNSKIDKIHLIFSDAVSRIYCQPFENLVEINLQIWIPILFSEETLPFFGSKNIIFKSLIYFKFEYFMDEINFKLIKNLYNNIDNMPKLETFILLCDVKNIKNDFYEKLIEKLLVKNLDEIDLKLKKEENLFYSLKQLKNLCPNLKDSNLGKINIRKLI